MNALRRILVVVAVIWALPYTMAGLMIGVAGLASGGQVRFRGRVVEFHGGAVTRFLRCLPNGEWVMAFTLGHTILGRSEAALDVCREHELVHVRQFERWGPLMGPAYLLCSFVLWAWGKDAYRDNPFEKQAFEETP